MFLGIDQGLLNEQTLHPLCQLKLHLVFFSLFIGHKKFGKKNNILFDWCIGGIGCGIQKAKAFRS